MTENNKQFILNDDWSDLQDCKCVMDNYVDVNTWYTLGATVDLLNELNDENRELKLDNKQFKKQLKIYEKFLEFTDLYFDWTEFCTADECINEYKDCIDDEIDCKDCVYLEDIND